MRVACRLSGVRIQGVERITNLLAGVFFKDGVPASGRPPERQPMAA
jgi:hypothetical protein